MEVWSHPKDMCCSPNAECDPAGTYPRTLLQATTAAPVELSWDGRGFVNDGETFACGHHCAPLYSPRPVEGGHYRASILSYATLPSVFVEGPAGTAEHFYGGFDYAPKTFPLCNEEYTGQKTFEKPALAMAEFDIPATGDVSVDINLP